MKVISQAQKYIDKWVGYDKAHCEPSDWVKTNQWVCANAPRFVRINTESMITSLLFNDDG